MAYAIEKLNIKNFTCFEEVQFTRFSKGINVLMGKNGTGKTHVLKALYVLSYEDNFKAFDPRLIEEGTKGGHYLIQYVGARNAAELRRSQEFKGVLEISLNDGQNSSTAVIEIVNATSGDEEFIVPALRRGDLKEKIHTFYLPLQEMLSWQKGFINIYLRQENGFDRVYYDLAVALNGAKLKSPYLEEAEALISEIKETIQAEVYQDENGRFYFKFYNEDLILEPPVVATGINKLGQLMYLILNGSITKNTIVFWDEPEANLNPQYISVVAKVLKTLAKAGCQLFIATHDYLLIHLLSLDAEYPQQETPGMRFFSFYKTPQGTKIEEGDTLADLQHNVILYEYAALHEKELSLYQENLK